MRRWSHMLQQWCSWRSFCSSCFLSSFDVWDQRCWFKVEIWCWVAQCEWDVFICFAWKGCHCTVLTLSIECVCLKVTKALQANCFFFFLSFNLSLVLRFSFVSIFPFFLYMKLYFPHFIRLNQIKEYQRMFHMNNKKTALKANGFLWSDSVMHPKWSAFFSRLYSHKVFFLINFPIGISKKSLLKKKYR